MSNIEKLTDYINRQEDPEQFMNTLFAICSQKGSADNAEKKS